MWYCVIYKFKNTFCILMTIKMFMVYNYLVKKGKGLEVWKKKYSKKR